MQNISTTPSTTKTHTLPQKAQLKGKYAPVHLNTNMFNIIFSTLSTIFQIPITFQPEINMDSREKLDEIISANRKELIAQFGQFFISGHCLFTFKPVNKKVLFDHHEDHALILEKKNVKKVDSSMMLKQNLSQEVLRFLNIMIKNQMKALKYVELGKDMKYFNLNKGLNTASNTFKIFEGFKTTVDCYEGFQVKIMIDRCIKITRNLTLWEEILEKDEFFRRKYSEEEAFNRAIEEVAIGQQCLADYGNKKIYRIEGIDEDLTPMSEFPKNSNGYKTYFEYFSKVYKKVIQDKEQPLVYAIRKTRVRKNGKSVKVQEKIHLVPELLRATGMTDQQSADFRLMKEIDDFTKKTPADRMAYAYEHGDNLNRQAASSNNGMEIDLYSNEIQGKQLNFPQIEVGKKKTVPLSLQWGGNFQIKSEVSEAVPLKKWGLIYMKSDIHGGKSKHPEFFDDIFYAEIFKIGKKQGTQISEPKCLELSQSEEKQGLEKIKKFLEQAKKNNFQIVVIILPDHILNGRIRLYGKVHKLAAEIGISLQVLNAKGKALLFRGKVDHKKISAYMENVCLQMLRKVGSVLWKVQNYPYEEELVKGRKDAKTARPCLVGIDVCHMKGMKSVVGISGTTNREFTQTWTDIKIQPRDRPQEIVDFIGEKVVKIVKEYAKSNNGLLPTNVIVYRDGVGQGQIHELNMKEVESIVSSLKKEFPKDTIDVSVILVTKRINERFFTNDVHATENPGNGVIVDNTITREGEFEWFMVAQKVTQGCATPTKFRMIYNEAEGVAADYWYNLTYYTTFMFANWKGPIRVPMVMQNAHTVAYKSSKAGITEIHPSLKNVEFFL